MELAAFLDAANKEDPLTRSFCLTLAHTGARLSEVRGLAGSSIDEGNCAIVFKCLKRRRPDIFRAVPVPSELIELILEAQGTKVDPFELLWPWSRTTAWGRVKRVCRSAELPLAASMPKALRHTFGIRGVVQRGIPLGTMKRWLGHARLESTLIYTDAIGTEERRLMERMWANSDRLRSKEGPRLRDRT
jgi:integrase/recombinase XerD